MAAKMVGRGSQYAYCEKDKDGEFLDGGKTYKLTIPPNVPAKDFWSFTLYDNQTRSMLQTDERFPGIDDNKPGMIKNADGSWDIYFGPKAPAGKEGNWIQTMPGKAWFPYFRLYSPKKAFLDRTWVLPDIEKVN